MNNIIKPRPLSPHLTIYKKIQTALLSIIHRMTGFALSIGTIFIVIWIFSLALGEKYFNIIYYILGTTLFKIILFLWSFCIFYHLINGLRYLYWSLGYGTDLKHVYISGYIVIIFSVLTTLLLWIVLLDFI